MSSKDMITKEYMSKRPYFADAFNSCVFDGKQVVKALTGERSGRTGNCFCKRGKGCCSENKRCFKEMRYYE